jgi:peptide/nickel transport system substrate-binding protein
MKPRLLLLTLIALLAASCSQLGSTDTSLVYGLTLAPSGIDPHLNASSELTIPLTSVYDTLVYQDPESGEYVPGLAEGWVTSQDGLSYTFFLRQDVIFHDGTPFNAQAVLANLDYVRDPDHHSQKAVFMLGPLEEVEIIDEFTVALHLSQPFAPLMDSLSQAFLGMASPEALEKWGPTEYQFHQVGTGPYRFVEYVPNDHLTLEVNPDYAWAPSIYESSQAEVESITFLFYADPATRALALESGEVDVVGEVPPRDAARLAASGDFSLYPVPIPGQPLQFFFNTQNPPTDQVEVRQALIMAVDRSSIVNTVFGEYSPVAQGPLAANTLGYSAVHSAPDYAPDQAGDLLSQSGWALNQEDGLRYREDAPLDLLIIVPPWGSSSEVAQLVAAAWESLGSQVRIEVALGFGKLKEAQEAGEYHAISFNTFGTDPDLLQSFYVSNAIYNWSGIADPDIDALLEDAAQVSFDTELRALLYHSFADWVHENAPTLPIRDYVNVVVANSRVQNLRFTYQGWAPLLFDLEFAP